MRASRLVGNALEVLEVPEEPEIPEERPRARRRGRTTLLIVAAAVLGVVAGTCTGYLIQADREPTKLASLSQPALAQAKGPSPEPLPASQDRRVKTDGDLRKLLLKKPAGAKTGDWVSDDRWLTLAEVAETADKPGGAFGDLVSKEFRRAADTGWRVGSAYGVEIRLVQYRQEEAPEASDAADGENYYEDSKAGTDSWSVPGSGNAMAYVHTRPDTEPGYLPQYNAAAVAWRGDILMKIFVWDTKPISKAKIMDLAERQVKKL
ncbi:hypothetical protein QFZ22_005547 [Streptomyces canus]|uniref:Spondin domain-containing protein n=1 Tax=Streptomyces canus TaxID=58343 RepID=A0AAW8FKH5_9ACTN|nr:hypothetical protein [Streptomyces canus]